MRKRQLLGGLALTLVVLFGTAGAAHAVSEEELREECIHILEEGGDVDECQEAPSPILPETNEIIWGALSFAAVFGLLAWKGFPAIKRAMEERTARIQADVDAAESAKAEVSAKAAEYDAKLAEARTEAARIIEEARQDADAYRNDKRAEADAEIARMKEQAAADVEASKAQAIADIRGEVATLAIGAAETVVGQNLDRAANEALVEQFINSVGARGN
jgi:F-type H+-transporting ATPase subunit b